MLQGFVNSFRPTSYPLMVRRNYRHELLTASTLPVAMTLTEGAVVGVLALKLFDVSAFQYAMLQAAPFFANLTSFVWTWLAKGKPKVPFVVGLMALALVSILAVGMLPVNATGAALLVVLTVATRCLLAGIVTIRASLWRMNYPKQMRAQITSRFVFLAAMIAATSPWLIYLLLDYQIESFRWLYPLAAGVGFVGVWFMYQVRVRRERVQLNFEQSEIDQDRQRRRERREAKQEASEQGNGKESGWVIRFLPGALSEPVYLEDTKPESQQRYQSRSTYWAILKEDRIFRWYMICQFLMGIGNMMAITVTIKLITTMTGEDQYALAVFLTFAVPMAMAMVSLDRWAKYMDRVHIVQFRVYHNFLFCITMVLHWLAAGLGLLWLFGISQTMQGISRGGGMLAWQLGHNDFAKRELNQSYMGIHVMLTGVRGAVGPFLAIWLLSGWDGPPPTLPGVGWTLPAFSGIGSSVYAISLGLLIASQMGYLALRRTLQRQGTL